MKKVLSTLALTAALFGASTAVGVNPASADINIVKMFVVADDTATGTCRTAQYLTVKGVRIKVYKCIEHMFISCYRDSEHANTGWCGAGWYMEPVVATLGWLACSQRYTMHQSGTSVILDSKTQLKCAPSAPYFPG